MTWRVWGNSENLFNNFWLAIGDFHLLSIRQQPHAKRYADLIPRTHNVVHAVWISTAFLRVAFAAVLIGTSSSVNHAQGFPISHGTDVPATPAILVTDTVHSEMIIDPYRWLEGDLSNTDPNAYGTSTPEVLDWTEHQNTYTRAVLDTLPGRSALEARMRDLMDIRRVGSPNRGGNRYFYSRRDVGLDQPVIAMQERSPDGTFSRSTVVLDPICADPTGLTTISWRRPNHDGSILAFGMFASGDENSTLHLKDIDAGEWLADEIPGKVRLSRWFNDNRRFLYSRLVNPNDAYSREFRIHEIGRHWREDEVLISQKDTDWFFPELTPEEQARMSTTWGPWLSMSENERWAIIGYWMGTTQCRLWVADMEDWRRNGKPDSPGRLLSTGLPGRPGSWRIQGNTLYMEVGEGSPAGRLVRIDLLAQDISFDTAHTLIAEDPGAPISSVSFTRSHILVNRFERATTRIDIHDYTGALIGQLPLPGIGTAWITADERTDEVFLSFTSFDRPRTIFHIPDLRELAPAIAQGRGNDAFTTHAVIWDTPDIPVDPDLIKVSQVTYDSNDGTPITMFLVHRRDLELNGTNPALLYGYGGFNISQTPSFRATLVPWLERGGVYAVPNLRGGGEYGDEWHRAATKEHKQNTFDDFIAAAEWLIDNGYTSTDHLAVHGGSNGGLLTGAVLVQRPDLFAAVVSAVPLLDMLRFDRFLMARFWVGEYGDPNDPKEFSTLRAYSPYHHIKPGTAYPAVLLTAGENDTRVHPMHARKMAARLQAATTSDPTTTPVLLKVEMDAGHGSGKPFDLRIQDAVDTQAFIMWQTGMLPE
ncbi:MAG: prolyl oligopeptidase family serine peptidase [Planctomycetota bacterium]